MDEKNREYISKVVNMDKKVKFFERLYISKIKQICFFVLSMLILLCFYSFALMKIEKMKEKELFVDNIRILDYSDYELSYKVETLKKVEGKLELSGWVFDLDTKNRDIQVALRNVENSEIILCKTEMCGREDIERYYGNISLCGDVGFLSQIVAKKLYEDNCYEVLLALESDDATVRRFSTGRYIYNGELFMYNPLDFVAPVVEDEEFTEAICKGEVCAYDSEKKMWIYRYNENLYYIIDYSVIGNIEQYPKIPVYLYTSQQEKLPESVRSEGIGRADYVLKANECMNENGSKFYLLMVPIGVEYPITCIRTGVYQDEKWDWMVTFRP